jgi:antitoxin ChpS
MATAKLRKVGGSTMLAIPPAVLKALDLSADATVEMAVENRSLVVKPARPRYTLEELLAQCDPTAPMAEEDRQWLASPPVGREEL